MKKLNIIKISTILLVVVIFTFLFVNAGNFLVSYDKPKNADVIVVLSGDKGTRTQYAVKLYKQGYASKIIVSGGIVYNKTSIAQLMRQQAEELGVPSENIILEDKADSTFENAIYSRDILLKNDFRSAIIVTSNYHTRRSKLIFNKVFSGTNIQLTYCASEGEYFDQSKWWLSNKSAMIVINEYIKFVGYALGKNT